MTFNDRDYTRDSLIKQLGLVELHCKDGSALDAGCACIETKHLYNIEGLSEEGAGFALSERERKFFQELGDLARDIRKRMEVEDWSLPKAEHHMGNPAYREYLPHGLTVCEKSHKAVQVKLAKCIRTVEERENCVPPYTDCRVNPVAVCRASVACP